MPEPQHPRLTFAQGAQAALQAPTAAACAALQGYAAVRAAPLTAQQSRCARARFVRTSESTLYINISCATRAAVAAFRAGAQLAHTAPGAGGVTVTCSRHARATRRLRALAESGAETKGLMTRCAQGGRAQAPGLLQPASMFRRLYSRLRLSSSDGAFVGWLGRHDWRQQWRRVEPSL